jgi:hypothetical protein
MADEPVISVASAKLLEEIQHKFGQDLQEARASA